MKIGATWILIVILLVISIHSFAYAQDLTDQALAGADKVIGGVETVQDIVQDPVQSREELRKTYLTTAWGEIFESKPIIGSIIRGYRKISPYTDPYVEFIVGMAPSLSWYFFLIFLIWILLVKYFYAFYEVLRDFSTFSNSTSIWVSSAVFVILTVLRFFQGIAKWIADKVVSLFSLFGEWYVQLIAIIILFLLLIILGKFSKSIKYIAIYVRMQRKKNKEERERAERDLRQEKATKNLEKITGAFSDSVKD